MARLLHWMIAMGMECKEIENTVNAILKLMQLLSNTKYVYRYRLTYRNRPSAIHVMSE